MDLLNSDFTNMPVSKSRPNSCYQLQNWNSKPQVSIITPFCNMDERFHETIISILQQSFQQWEWIIINMGSKICESFPFLDRCRFTDPRIHIIDLPYDSDLLAARNQGIAIAKADYLVLLDSHDLLEPTAIEKWFWFLEAHPDCSMAGDDSIAFGDQNSLFVKGSQNTAVNLLGDRIDHAVMIRKKITPKREGLLPRIRNFKNKDIQPIYSGELNLLARRQKRLLLIIPRLEEGGADKFNLDMMSCLKADGWEITIVATLPGENRWLFEYEKYSTDIFILDNFLEPFFYSEFISYLIKSRQYAVCLITNSQFGFDITPFLRLSFPKMLLFSLCHTELDEGIPWGGFAKQIADCKEYFDLNIVISKHLKESMVKHGMDERRIQVCYAGMDVHDLMLNPQTLDDEHRPLSGSKKAVILFIGRLSKEKNPYIMVLTFKKLHNSGIPFEAMIIGDGPYYSKVKTWIKDFDLSGVVSMMGSQPIENVKSYYNHADILFLPSEREGIALVLFEAMASKLPVVSANVGGQSELVTPDVGFLIEKQTDRNDEVDLYVDALSKLVLNPDLRRSMGMAGYHRVRTKFNDEIFNNTVLNIFNTLPEPCLCPKVSEMFVNTHLKNGIDHALEIKQYYESNRKTMDRLHINSENYHAIDGIELGQSSKLYRMIKKILAPVYSFLIHSRMVGIINLKEKLKYVISKINVRWGV